MTNKCPFCGNETDADSKFCGSCGHQLTNTNNAAAPAEPVEAAAEPADIPAAPTETPVEPQEVPAQVPVYSAPQQPVPVYNSVPQQYGAPTQTAVKKNKKALVLAIITGTVIVLGVIAAILTFFLSGGSAHNLDGEYKLTALKMGDQDYSSYIGYLESDYLLKVDGSDITIEAQGYKTSAKIDQKNHTISSGEFGTVEFTVDGNDITLNLNSQYTMTFTRQ